MNPLPLISWIILFPFLLIACGGPQAGEPLSSAPTPRATIHRDGVAPIPFASISDATAAAEGGDVIRLAPGLFHEVVRISGDRRDGGGVVVEGSPEGTILDGADPELQSAPNSRWSQAEDGTYQAVVDWDGPIERAHVSWVVPAEGFILPAYHKQERWLASKRGPGTLRIGRKLKFNSGDLGDPGQISLSVGISEGVVRFNSARGWTLSNVELRHGGNAGVRIDDGCSDLAIVNVTVKDTRTGIGTQSEPEEISRIVIRDCKISNRWSHAWPWAEGYADSSSFSDDYVSPMRGTGIEFYGSDSIIADNTIQDTWDGMAVRGKNIDVYGNVISGIQDDGVELECGQSSNIRFHDNILYGVFVGISVGSNQPGPVYIYRNRVSANRLHISDPDKGRIHRFGYALKIGNDWGPGTANISFYHNTFHAKRLGLWDSETAVWENFVFLNNIFVNEGLKDLDGARESYLIWNSGLAEKGVQWDGNLFWRAGHKKALFRKWNKVEDVRDLQTARITNPNWEEHGIEADPAFLMFNRDNNAKNDFELSEDSPARNRAVSLPKGWPDSQTIDDGMPDIGAVEFRRINQ